MSETAIRIEGLGKRYKVGRRKPSLFERLRLTPKVGESASDGNGDAADFWALKDVSFEVKRGEAIGIIGRNGAGKSTLLKILSRITEPSRGRVDIYGRVGSLLEVGTGFHPDLTGRENTYLNGAILGMRRGEIRSKFDEIVSFAELDKFIDTPVKYYSSGMYMRLAFAVAAHLEPEILVVDEVLAVGDVQFQEKCLGKMGQVSRAGRTVIFISHNLGAIQRLCSDAVVLRRGRLEFSGAAHHAIDRYLRILSSDGNVPLALRTDRIGDGRAKVVGCHWEDHTGARAATLRSGGEYVLVLSYICPDGESKADILGATLIKDEMGAPVLHHQSNFSSNDFGPIPPRGQLRCHVRRLPLAPGVYFANFYVGTANQPCDEVADALRFSVEFGDFYGTGQSPRPELCKVLVNCKWDVQRWNEGNAGDSRQSRCESDKW